MNIHKFKTIAITSLLTLTLSGCISTAKSQNPPEEYKVNIIQNELKQKEPQKSIENVEPVVQTATISAIGDVLLHSSLYKDARLPDGSYDFKPMFAKVKPYLSNSDITIANSESIIGGSEIGVSSYPSFNSPYEVGDALKDVGIDIVTMANNHTLDRGEKAIINAINYWDKIGVKHIGSYKDFESSKKIEVIEKNGIKFSFIGYTYGTNGIPTPQGKDYLVNRIDKVKIKNDIQKAEEVSDVVVLNLHVGNEYERVPNDYQKELTQFAVDEGADILFLHHSHTLQPTSWLTGKDGNQAFVIYSLGNFLSGQNQPYTQFGGLAKVEVQKTINGEIETIELKNPEFLPTYVKYQNCRDFDIIPMQQLTDNDLMNAQQHYEEIKSHMSQYMTDLEFITE